MICQPPRQKRALEIMKIYKFHAQLWLPLPPHDLFPFFSDAFNLEELTPPWLHFRTLTPAPIIMRQGTMIDYRLRVHKIPIRWRSEITEWEPPTGFTDEQRVGPYRFWKHRHAFHEHENGTVASDTVEYAVWGGSLINKFFVEPDVRRIFRYREEKLKLLFFTPFPPAKKPCERLP